MLALYDKIQKLEKLIEHKDELLAKKELELKKSQKQIVTLMELIGELRDTPKCCGFD